MGKYGERNGGFDCPKLSPGSPCYEYTIGSNESEIGRQMKKKSRKKKFEDQSKEKERNENDGDERKRKK